MPMSPRHHFYAAPNAPHSTVNAEIQSAIQRRSLPQQVQDALPPCGRACLSAYISQQQACSTSDLSCLCSQTFQGFTLGELAYACYDTSCPQPSHNVDLALYSICSTLPNDVSPTHLSLMLPPPPSTTSSGITTSTASGVMVSTSGITTTTLLVSASTTSSSFTSNPSVTAPPTHSASTPLSTSSPSVTASPAPSKAAPLTVPQTVGVCLAAFAFIFISVGLVYLCACLRRRRAQKYGQNGQKSYDFVDDGPAWRSPYIQHGPFASPQDLTGGFEQRPTDSRPEDKTRSLWLIGRDSGLRRADDGQGRFLDPRTDARPASAERLLRDSPESARTESQLLPDKPTSAYAPRRPPTKDAPEYSTSTSMDGPPLHEYGHDLHHRQPLPLQQSQRVPPLQRLSPQRIVEAAQPTGRTLFEEDRSPHASPNFSTSPPPPLPQAAHETDLKPSRSFSRRPQYATEYPSSPQPDLREQEPVQHERQPSLSLEIPRQASRTPQKISLQRPTLPRVPVNDQQSARRRQITDLRAKSQASSTDGLLDYYSSVIPKTTPDTSPPLVNSPTPIEDEAQKRYHVPEAITVSGPMYPPRAFRQSPSMASSKSPSSKSTNVPVLKVVKPPKFRRRDSAASDTSFESTDSDEPTPPDENDKQLSPVHEAHSPIAAVRYPKIPRSSNQRVPRSPGPKLSPQFIKHGDHRPPTNDDRTVLPSMMLPQEGEEKKRSKRSPKTPPEQQIHAAEDLILTGSTLGNTAAWAHASDESNAGLGLDGRLVIDTSHSRVNSNPNIYSPPRGRAREARESPLKGYGRATTASHKTPGSGGFLSPDMISPRPQVAKGYSKGVMEQEVLLKSPLWEPKLTPSRRGDDMYLDVSMATPIGDGRFLL